MTIASIDIGTNTILLLIAEVDDISHHIKALHNEYRIPRIGRGLLPSEPIKSEQRDLLFKVLEEYKNIISKFNCEHVIVTATNALRMASNSKELINDIKKKFSFNTNVVSGTEESRLSYIGTVSENPLANNKTMLIDIGGGSTEITYGIGVQILFNESYQIGAVSCFEKFLKHEPPVQEELETFKEYVSGILNKIEKEKINPQKTFAIAGTPTTLACIKNNLSSFNEGLIEGTMLTNREIEDFINLLSSLTPKEIKSKFKKVVDGSEDILLAGTIILNLILSNFQIPEVVVSTKGIRYGAIVDYVRNNFKD